MRIVFNALSLPAEKTGGGVYMLNLLREMRKQCEAEKFKLIVLVHQGNAFHFAGLVSEHFVLHDCGFLTQRRPARLLWEQLLLPSLCRKLRADILHSPGFVAPLLLKGVKSVVTVFDTSWFSHAETHQSVKTLYFKTMIPPSLKRAERIIAISESTKQDILSLFPVPEEKVAVTLLAGNGEAYHNAPADDNLFAALQGRYHIRKDFLLYVGTVEPRKNLQRLCDAFLLLKRKGYNGQLIIVGKKGWMVEKLYSFVAEHHLSKEVLFCGYLPDEEVAELMKRCCCFVYPSLYEGFGIPVSEALSCGAVVVTSDCSSLPEVAGDAGFLAEPDDTADIAANIEKVLHLTEEQRAEQKQKSLSQAERFSWERTAQQTLDIYRSLCL